jgi:hypothetical protein
VYAVLLGEGEPAVELGEGGGVELGAREGAFGVLVCLGVCFIICRRNCMAQLAFRLLFEAEAGIEG